VTDITWIGLGDQMLECSHEVRLGGQHCFHASVVEQPGVRLNAVQEAQLDNGTLWFDRPGDSITIGGMTFPLTTTMVPCDKHLEMAQPLLDIDNQNGA
jgi:hypothetical protein